LCEFQFRKEFLWFFFFTEKEHHKTRCRCSELCSSLIHSQSVRSFIMWHKHPFRSFFTLMKDNPVIPILALIVTGVVYGCFKSQPLASETPVAQIGGATSGEDFLVEALDEVQSIADWAQARPSANPKLQATRSRVLLAGTTAESTYVYGQLTPDGFGAVVTERHQYPKGLLLITVRKSHGAAAGKIVTETKRYISLVNFQNEIPSQSNLTEIYTTGDTIVTRVLRNGLLETYTFRTPVITRNVNAVTGAVTIAKRYGATGAVVTEKRDGSGALIQTSKSFGQSDGSLVTRTDYPDSTWRSSRTLGQADGTILREITTGRGL
jgi:hypothetical protein